MAVPPLLVLVHLLCLVPLWRPCPVPGMTCGGLRSSGVAMRGCGHACRALRHAPRAPLVEAPSLTMPLPLAILLPPLASLFRCPPSALSLSVLCSPVPSSPSPPCGLSIPSNAALEVYQRAGSAYACGIPPSSLWLAISAPLFFPPPLFHGLWCSESRWSVVLRWCFSACPGMTCCTPQRRNWSLPAAQ